MPSNGKKAQGEILKDKLRSVFSPKDPQKKLDTLPPKVQFSIWYFLIALFFIFTTCSNTFFPPKWRRFPTASLNNTWPKAPWIN